MLQDESCPSFVNRCHIGLIEAHADRFELRGPLRELLPGPEPEMKFLSIDSQLRMSGKNHQRRLLRSLRYIGVATRFLHGIDEREDIVLRVGDGIKTCVAAEASGGPGYAFNGRCRLLLLGRQLGFFGPHTHHQRQRPRRHIVGLEDSAVGSRPDFRIMLNAHHLIDEATVRLGSGNDKLFVVFGSADLNSMLEHERRQPGRHDGIALAFHRNAPELGSISGADCLIGHAGHAAQKLFAIFGHGFQGRVGGDTRTYACDVS